MYLLLLPAVEFADSKDDLQGGFHILYTPALANKYNLRISEKRTRYLASVIRCM
jgi:hypothetical protein